MMHSLKVKISSSQKEAFSTWQSQLNEKIAAAPGFISLEILTPSCSDKFVDWVIVSRFTSSKNSDLWHSSEDYKKLLSLLKEIAPDFEEQEVDPSLLTGGVTEVLITRINKQSAADYRQWISRLHFAETKFPGFKGVFVQSPDEGENWITLLQFDTAENLDRWMTSPERKAILDEGKQLVSSLEAHRVISPYAGWFSSLTRLGTYIPVWKQTMIVLLVLFPIVMVQFKFLSPLLHTLELPIATFISNAISVSLISWPFMPIALYFLGWWLMPTKNKKKMTLLGIGLLIFLYLIEIFLFL